MAEEIEVIVTGGRMTEYEEGGFCPVGGARPKDYFTATRSEALSVDLRALLLGMEAKDLFIEANRGFARPKRDRARADDGKIDEKRYPMFARRREKPIEFARPVWRRP